MKVGDKVTRMLGGVIPMTLQIISETEERFICALPGTRDPTWEFDKGTGAEIDEYLGWGPKGTGSYIFVTDLSRRKPRRDS